MHRSNAWLNVWEFGSLIQHLESLSIEPDSLGGEWSVTGQLVEGDHVRDESWTEANPWTVTVCQVHPKYGHTSCWVSSLCRSAPRIQSNLVV